MLGFLKETALPQMAKAEQVFSAKKLKNIKEEINKELENKEFDGRISPGMKIAITGGSRGISNIDFITLEIVDYLKKAGADPFIVPAMGSHGGATAEGQKQVLETFGITEETMGVPIVSSMETVQLGQLEDGLPVYLDKNAYEADGIVLINRVKLHTGFRGAYESGIIKMLCLGLGKQEGAEAYHSQGLVKLSEYIVEAGKLLLGQLNVVMSVAIIENAYDETLDIKLWKQEEILEEEPKLLQVAKENMPSIKFRDLDVLIIDKIGKNYSGAGLDPNISGKFINPQIKSKPVAERMVILGLSDETQGNGNGVGLADVTTKRLFDQYDRQSTYMNGLTSGVSESSKIPMFFESDEYAIKAAAKLTGKQDTKDLRIVRISNTLDLKEIYISKSLEEEASKRNDVVIKEEFKPFDFDSSGNLF